MYIWNRIPGIHINIELSQYMSFVKFIVGYREAVTEFQGSTWHSCLTATCHTFDLCDLPVTFVMWPQHSNEFWAYKCPTLCFCFLKSMSGTLLWPLHFSSYEPNLHKSLSCLIALKTLRILSVHYCFAILLKTGIYQLISCKLPNMRFYEIQFRCLEHTKNNYCDRGNKI